MVTMQIDILTLFPDTIRAGLGESILGRAQKNDIIRIEPHQIRDYTLNKQKQVDDAPYGGGQGMIMQAQPLYDCWRDVCRQAGERVHTIYMSPAGKPFTQAEANRLQRDYSRLILVCGHYEGVDERVIEELAPEPREHIKTLIETKYLRSLSDEKGRRRTVAALQRMGYSWGDISAVLNEYEEEYEV